jgi:hypothetical protein
MWPRWLLGWGAAWLLILGAPVAVLLVMVAVAPHQLLARRQLLVIVMVASVVLLATVGFGMALGYGGRWLQVGVAALAGTATLAFWYVAAMISTASPDSGADNAAGAGVVILGLPVLAALTLLLYLGATMGWLLRRVRRRQSSDGTTSSSGSRRSPAPRGVRQTRGG